MTKPLTINEQRPLFSKRHYIWLASAAKSWTTGQQKQFALSLYYDNTNFNAVRWFQAVGHERAVAEAMAREVHATVNKMETFDNGNEV